VGAARLSVSLGPTRFYDGLAAFGLGQPTGIDLEGEIAGVVKRPGNADWFESDLGTNAFGQGIATTPLQLAMAIAAVANDGLLMEPHLAVQRIEPDGSIITYEPQIISRPISQETANILTQMMATALESEASNALVEGYRIAGKTGTAEIPVPGGYDSELTITSFVGYGPVDDPQFLVLVKLDQPTLSRWGSDTAAPVFRYFAERLVVLMEIPPDNIRLDQTGR
jgi:cell division protein FtsI/penicillin-binding protein 2